MEIVQSPAGQVINVRSYSAFIPHPLPPQFTWTDRLVNTLSKADYLLGKLSLEGSKLPNPHLLIRLFITREAVLSSKIEGTRSSIGELLADAVGAPTAQDPYDLQEVQNYIMALDYGAQRLADLPLSLRLIKEIHAKLMGGVRGKHATPGEFRRSQNWIGTPGSTLTTAKFVPPPPNDLLDCLSALERFLHDRTLPPLIHAALCHYQFEATHPFLDGNGRIGRLLIVLLLIERKILPSPLLYLSAFFETTRSEYYRQLFTVSAEGAWEEWLIYFLSGVASQSADALSRIERINQLLSLWQTQVVSRSAVAVELIKYLAGNPFVTVKNSAEHLKIAYTTAQRGVQLLVSLGIIAQVGVDKRNRVYCAGKILDILEEPAF